jgi:small conductance mechanosensitive channel
MPSQFRRRSPKPDLNFDRMFDTRSDAWQRAGLPFEVDQGEVRSARNRAIVLLPVLIAVVIAIDHVKAHKWHELGKGGTSFELPIEIVGTFVILALGWALARAVGKSAGPTFMRRLDPATAGTVGFLIRLTTMAIALVLALLNVGIASNTVAVGGAFTAVIFGLAAQQTLGNVFAGMVLLSARSFRVGDRVRLQAGAIGGQIDGIVSSLGLLYTTLTSGSEQIMIPNNQVLAAVVVPLKEPDSVDVRVRLSSGVRPTQVQAILDQEVNVPTRDGASVLLEEVDGDDVVVRIQATPARHQDGAKLADEIMVALSSVTGEHASSPSGKRR